MQPLFEHRLDIHEYGTRVLELEGSGPTLILLHGWGDSADTWRPLMARLGELDRAAIAVDMPGFGTASRLGPGAMLPQLDAFAGELVERVAEESGGPVVVVGNSLGGVVALRLAERADLPLAGVVPISPAGLDMPKWFEVIDRDPVIRTILSLPVPIPPPVIERAVGEVYRRLAFSRPGLADPQVVTMFAAHHRDRDRARRLLASGRRLLPELSSAKAFDFAKVRAPVLLIWGTLDRMVSHSGADRLREALGGRDLLRIELLDEVGHCPQLEATERVLDLLLGFPGARHARAA